MCVCVRVCLRVEIVVSLIILLVFALQNESREIKKKTRLLFIVVAVFAFKGVGVDGFVGAVFVFFVNIYQNFGCK